MAAPCVIDEGTLLEDFTDYSDWSADANGDAASRTWFSRTAGKLSSHFNVKQTTATSTTVYWTKTISQSYSAYKSCIAFDFFLCANDTLTIYSGQAKVTLEISSTSDFSKSFKYTTAYRLRTGWQRLMVSESEWTNTGSESWSNTMIRIRVGLTTLWTGHAPAMHADAIYGGVECKPVITFNFFDVRDTQMSVGLPLLETKGWTATSFLDLYSMDTAGRYSWADIFTLMDAGWEIGNDNFQTELINPAYSHTVVFNMGRHMLEAVMDETARIRQARHIYPTRIWLGGAVWYEDHHYAHVAFYKHHAQGVLDMGYLGDLLQAQPLDRDDALWMVPYALGGLSLATAEAAVDRAIARGAAMHVFVEGLVDSSPGAWDWLASDFEDLLDYIDGKGAAVEIMNLAEYVIYAQDQAPASVSDVILGTLNLNDMAGYYVEGDGLNLGQKQTTWEEVASYSSSPNAQVNVQRNALVPVTLPMMVRGTSLSDLDSKLAALWTEVDKQSNTLTIGSDSYSIVSSTRPDTVERDPNYQLGYWAHFTLTLMRTP